MSSQSYYPCYTTGRLIRAYEEVAYEIDMAVDKVVADDEFMHRVQLRMVELAKGAKVPCQNDLRDALINLRKNMAVPTLPVLKKVAAAGSFLVDDRS